MDEILPDLAALRLALAARPAGLPVSERRAALDRLHAAVRAREAPLVAALKADFGKGAVEVRLTELLPLYQELRLARRRLRAWARGRRVWPDLVMLGTSARVIPEPKGLCLIFGPSNYPFMLTLGPLVSAIAAGNRVVVKPSELTPHTAALLADLIAEAFAPDHVAVAQGGPETAQALLAQPFDHVFFTGSTGIGKQVMAAAAPHLASVTLELGGKSPVIVGPGADIAKAARMVAWGKLSNGGQACVAPDHLYLAASIAAPFLTALTAELARMAPDMAGSITPRHAARMQALLDDAAAKGARLLPAGQQPPGAVQPIVLTGTTAGMAVMQEEIFGPLLPVIEYDDLNPVIATLNAGPKPLTLYVFDRDPAFIDRIRRETRSGSVAVNLTMAHFAHPNLPFGGIGASGQGAAHGHAGFLAFSHDKPVVVNRFSALPLLMPPVTGRVRWMAGALLAWIRR
ncbi:aldehyde dehydrogenase family protein [Rhodobacter sp. Har01]|uniref:aldehyde dehydrogenase family protein n=1 Tax=Rhodobacter sp. Har01 TaxID=2883999 RepID=UPI001D06A35C|nr:aldehyde dehydrogenase family protein [Rhodobacter sp. Har01]MCB6178703.1 aldehyde dehydrogenase family protein [Rhodobacter sp. Har01]